MLYVELVRTIKVNLRRTVYIQWYITIFPFLQQFTGNSTVYGFIWYTVYTYVYVWFIGSIVHRNPIFSPGQPCMCVFLCMYVCVYVCVCECVKQCALMSMPVIYVFAFLYDAHIVCIRIGTKAELLFCFRSLAHVHLRVHIQMHGQSSLHTY